MLKKLGATGKTLIIDVAPQGDFALTARNIAGLSLVASNRVTARDVMDTVEDHRDARGDREAAGVAGIEFPASSCQLPTLESGDAERWNWQLATGNWKLTMKLTDIIRRPLITEKTTLLREAGRTVVFEVAAGATKVDIKRAVEKLLGSKVEARAHLDLARQVQAPGALHRPAVGLEEGLREAARRGEDPRVPGGGLSQFPVASFQCPERHCSGNWKLGTGNFKDHEQCLFANTSRRPPGRRFQTVQTFDDITATEPYKPLVEPIRKSGGRNNHGELTSWWRGGGHKRAYRIIDFKRDKAGIPAKVSTVEYDPNRSARIALLTYADGEKRYILQPLGLKVGDTIVSGDNVDILPGNALPLKNIPLGTMIHNVELKPGKGGQIARSAGSAVQLVAKEGDYASVKMPSGEIRKINVDCLATIGQVGNVDHENVSIGKAGRTPLAGQQAARARRRDEPGRPPARRR